MKTINITIDGIPQTVYVGTELGDIIPQTNNEGLPVVAARLNNAIVPLTLPLVTNATITTLTAKDEDGYNVIKRTISFLLGKAITSLYPTRDFRISHPIGNGIYYTFDWQEDEDKTKITNAIKKHIKELIKHDVPIEHLFYNYTEAIAILKEHGQHDKINLLRHRPSPVIELECCEGYYDLAQDPIVKQTSRLSDFTLIPFEEGLILNIKAPYAPHDSKITFTKCPLIEIYREQRKFGQILGITTVSELNESVSNGTICDIIRLSETLHAKRLAEIANAIATSPQKPRLILLAGPSSSGKTTTAMRLRTHLKLHGITTYVISTDDYFVGDERNPRDENGNLDYEHIRAIDLKRLNNDILSLLDGKEVTLPTFDFKGHKQRNRPYTTKLPQGGTILIEGIHALNPLLTDKVPDSHKFRIYIAPFTQLSIDRTTRISATNNRLLRRLIRDWNYRGKTPLDTLKQWPSVRAGEERWIFPFQDNADIIFNSSLDYEIGVLKPFAETILSTVKPDVPEYATAHYLLAKLQNFVNIDPRKIPGDSILRETIGESQLDYD